MKLSRAVALAADSVDLRAEQLRATAQALTMAQRDTEKPSRGRRRTTDFAPTPVAGGAGDTSAEAGRLAANLKAVQASRSLLMRTIDMLK